MGEISLYLLVVGAGAVVVTVVGALVEAIRVSESLHHSNICELMETRRTDVSLRYEVVHAFGFWFASYGSVHHPEGSRQGHYGERYLNRDYRRLGMDGVACPISELLGLRHNR